ncbi:MAG TPA: thioredoxin family protein [Candidatus Babeliales bacterium]|nr:thioredoxin family protein [Candidatus Babeliales bacterium]
MRYSVILSAIIFAVIGYALMKYMQKEETKNQQVQSTPVPAPTALSTEAQPQEPQKESKEKSGPTEIDSYESFQKITTISKLPLIVKCSAQWCPPCKIMAPLFDKAAQELSDVASFYTVDTDTFTDVDKLNIRGIPTFIIYKSGKEVSRFSGARSYESLKNEIEKSL